MLSFAHQEVGSNLSPTLVITPGGSGRVRSDPAHRRTDPLTTTPIDVTSCLNTPAKLNGASIAYQVHLTDNGTSLSGTASVDGAQIAATTIATGTKTITLGSFGPTLPVTTGWDGLTINVAHSESAGTNPTLVVTPGGGAACTIPLTVHPSLATDSVVLGSACPIKNSAAVNGITVQYQATGTTNADRGARRRVAQRELLQPPVHRYRLAVGGDESGRSLRQHADRSPVDLRW